MKRAIIAVAVVHVLGAGLSAEAQQAGSAVGTIVIAHGADDSWNAPVLEVASQAETGGPVEVSFLMGGAAPTHRFQDAAARLVEQGAQRIVVVPLFASSFSGHYNQLRYLVGDLETLDETMMMMLHMSGIDRATVSVPISLAPALDGSGEVATILAERALKIARAPTEQALFIVGHGPNSAEDHAEWMRNLRPLADSVARLTGFRDVKVGLVRDDAPAAVREEAVRGIREVIALQAQLTGQSVVVVPLLISRGSISTDEIPTDLAGLDITYDPQGLLPHPEMATWVERRVREAAPR